MCNVIGMVLCRSVNREFNNFKTDDSFPLMFVPALISPFRVDFHLSRAFISKKLHPTSPPISAPLHNSRAPRTKNKDDKVLTS